MSVIELIQILVLPCMAFQFVYIHNLSIRLARLEEKIHYLAERSGFREKVKSGEVFE